MIDKMEYIQAAALVKVSEKKLLSMSTLTRMIDANTAFDILKILSETDYSKSMAFVVREEDFEKILSNETKRAYLFAKELVKDHDEILQILALKYEFQNLKIRLKGEIINKQINDKIIKLAHIDLEKEYKLAINEYEKTNDIQKAVVFLDRLYFEKLKKMCSSTGLEILYNYYNLLINSYNLVTFLRLKNQKRDINYASYCIFDNEELLNIYEKDSYIDDLKKMFDNKKMWDMYLKFAKISYIEKELDNLLINEMKKYKNVNYGIEPIITYIIAKEYEIKAIRLIMTAKINKIDITVIKERMRDIYV